MEIKTIKINHKEIRREGMGLDSSGSGEGLVVGSFKHGTEPSQSSIEGGKFLH
jgi:hypothetical protein